MKENPITGYSTDANGYAIYNPLDKPVAELPVIYGFNNGGSPNFMYAQLIAEDGTTLGSHLCSSEGFMRGDLGIYNGFRPDRHITFRGHYPDGYRMDFVSLHEIDGHEKLNAAFTAHNEQVANDKAHEATDQ